MGDEFARLRRFGLVKLRDAVGYREKKTDLKVNPTYRHLCATRTERGGQGKKKKERTIGRLVHFVARQISSQSPEPFPVQAPQADVRFGETRRHDGRVLGERDGREAVLRGWRSIAREKEGGSREREGRER